jgi:hypothetical protein
MFQEGSRAFQSGSVEIYKEGVGSFLSFVRYDAGDGSKIKFWHDLWCGDQPLKGPFMELFSITRYKEVWVANH